MGVKASSNKLNKQGSSKHNAEADSSKKNIKKPKQYIKEAVAHITANCNNTLICITNKEGDVLGWQSCGTSNFKGARKGTPYAAQVAAERVMKAMIELYGISQIEIVIKGIGPGKESAAKALEAVLSASRSIRKGDREDLPRNVVTKIDDVTPIPHNGCRARKERRV